MDGFELAAKTAQLPEKVYGNIAIVPHVKEVNLKKIRRRCADSLHKLEDEQTLIAVAKLLKVKLY
jgi:hypothetical protein